jgi:hypothetical protein
MIRNLPLLAILRVDKLLLHEVHDKQRTLPLVDKVRKSGVLRNPPIITPLMDRTGRYMVLDGAHRTLSFQMLEIPHILAQVVDPDDPGLQLNPWNHVIWEMKTEELLDSLQDIPNLELVHRDMDAAQREMTNKQALAIVRLPSGETYAAQPPSADLGTRVHLLHAIVNQYQDRGKMDRTNLIDMEKLNELYTELTGLVMMPAFRIEDILYLVGEGVMLPPGSTRFTIAPRALHVNYPLEKLSAPKSLEEKDAWLQEWLQEKIENKSVRYYEEPTFLFDE